MSKDNKIFTNLHGDYANAVNASKYIFDPFSEKGTIWSHFAQNLLVFLLLYIDGAKEDDIKLISDHYKDEPIEIIKDIVNSQEESITLICEIAEVLPETHPAYASGMEFYNTLATQKMQIIATLKKAISEQEM